MWNISRLKLEARNSLKQFGYWMPLLVTFLIGIVNGIGGSTTGSGITLIGSSDLAYNVYIPPIATPDRLKLLLDEILDELENFFSNPFIVITTVFLVLAFTALGFLISFAFVSFVSGPLDVGQKRYFMEHRGWNPDFDRIFWAFKGGRYLNIVKISFLKEIKIALWSLLFVIPGIVKSYEYRMVPYLLSENPQMSSKRAFELSKAMTKGEKWHMFCLDLSFIGWKILGALCCGVGTIFLVPYLEATSAELYQVLREKAHGYGFSDFGELPGFFPEQV